MFTKVMAIILPTLLTVAVYAAGHFVGYQKGYADGACVETTDDLPKQQTIEIMANYIISKESSFRPGQWGDLDKPHKTYGKAQFQRRTFYWMAQKAGLKSPDWKNEEQQVWLLKWALRNGYGKHWGKNYTQALHVAFTTMKARHTIQARI